MKILMMIIRYQGGHGTVARELKKELQKRGHSIKIISREDDNFTKKQLRSFIKENGKDYDIIYTFDWSMALPLLFPYPIHLKKHYCSFHGHNPTKAGSVIQTIIGRFMGKKLVVVGDTLKKRFPKSTLVYNGVDFDTFKDLKKERKYLGWIERDYDLITKEEVIKLADKMGLPLITANHIPYTEMNEFYNKCKAFISLPPFYTGFNLCWLEAKAAGVKEIIHNKNGIGYNLDSLNIKNFTWKNSTNKLLEVFNGFPIS